MMLRLVTTRGLTRNPVSLNLCRSKPVFAPRRQFCSSAEDSNCSSTEEDIAESPYEISDSEDLRRLSTTALTDNELLTDLEENHTHPQIFGSQYYKFPVDTGHSADIINVNTDSETSTFENFGNPVDILKGSETEYQEYQEAESLTEGEIPEIRNKHPIFAKVTGTEDPRNIEKFKYLLNPNEMITDLKLDSSDLERDDTLAAAPVNRGFETRLAKEKRKIAGKLKFTMEDIDATLATPELFSTVPPNSTSSTKYEENTLRIRQFQGRVFDQIVDESDETDDDVVPIVPIVKPIVKYTKCKVPGHLLKSKDGAETIIWIEILQRGRTLATEFGVDPRVASKEMIHGLSLAEWLGFIEKYTLDNPELRGILQTPPEDSLNIAHPDLKLSSDPRFPNNSKFTINELIPDIKNVIWKMFKPSSDKIDPRVLEASIHETLISQGLRVINKGPIASNPFRVKPTGTQESLLASLLNRCKSTEFSQVQEKKLYEPESEDSQLKNIRDSLAQLALIGMEDPEPKIAPSITLPEQFRVPTLIEEIEEVLDDSEPNPDDIYRKTRDLVNKNIDTLEDNLDDLSLSSIPVKKCKICAGKKLDPMNGGLLMQLVDDCGLVLPRRQTGLCTKHQRKVPAVMARSIAMGVFSWKEGPLVHLDPFKPVIDDNEVIPPNILRRGV